MLHLAEKYAELKGTKVIAHAERDDTIIFVLESGPKLTMTQAELEAEIKNLTPTAPTAPPAAEPADDGGTPPNPQKKGKGKK